jgi:hypothetical protein
MVYETDTNRVLVYDSAAWVMIADTDTPAGLELVKTQTVGSAVSSVEVTGAFSSTYDIYKITYTGGVASADTAIYLQLGSSTTGYYGSTYGANASGTADNGGMNNSSNWLYAGVGTSDTATLSAELVGPNLTKYTHLHSVWFDPRTSGAYRSTTGVHRVAASYTAFTIATYTGGATLTGGTIRVYGYRNSI